MDFKKLDPKELDVILDRTMESINTSKSKLFEIGEHSHEECQEINQHLQILKEELESLQNLRQDHILDDRVARAELVKISKNFHNYGEPVIRKAYEKAADAQIRLSVSMEKESRLKDEISHLEQRLFSLQNTSEKAEAFMSQISTVLSYLGGELRLYGEVIEDAKRKQEYGLRIIEAQEEERKRLSREIHDGPAQVLANVLLRSQLIERIYEKKGKDEAFKEIKDMRALIEDALKEVRRLIYDLRPMALDDLGLIPTLMKYLNKVDDRSDADIYFDYYEGIGRLHVRLEAAIFRLVQEAIQNALKHSEASEINVDLNLDGDKIVVVIQDNGIGFDVNVRKDQSFGLIGMKERVGLLNGTIDVQSTPNKGTYILIRIPILEQEGV
ncbi:sensor histidine kinase [Pseudalkalibacillus hwajinpoensis]|uniref:sensor histidine kinase n=1 Tax=Guptibacillus hwajinpoensis TaxID=208199 RepID=UPI00325B7F26